ncbi:MAG: SPASM domain-containing protein, partial [Verrucomicrobiota bacterium]
ENRGELDKVLEFAKQKGVKITVNVIHDSLVYYGKSKKELRPEVEEQVNDLRKVVSFYKKRWTMTDLGKVWFYNNQINYLREGKRPLTCDAGERSFFLDSRGNMYVCLFKPWKMGNLNEQSFEEIWSGAEREGHLPKVHACNDCWLTCSAKEVIKSQKMNLAVNLSKMMLGLHGRKAVAAKQRRKPATSTVSSTSDSTSETVNTK